MSRTASIIGAGTTVGYTAFPTPASYTLLAEVRDVKQPHTSVDKYEATHYTSSALVKEYLFGWIEAGEVPIETNYLNASQSALFALLGVMKTWQITLPDTHTITFSGALDDWSGDIPNKGVCNIKLKIKLSTLPVFA